MPLDATNGGHFRPIEFDTEPGLIVSPQRPAPCDSYGYVGVALAVLLFRAMSEAVPDRCPAGGYQLSGASLFRVDPRYGEPFIMMGPLSGGDGARPFADGPTLVFAGNGDTPNTPVEIIETRFPVRCEEFSILSRAAGAGEYRGGYGLQQDLLLLEEGIVMQMVNENSLDPLGKGLAGGRDGVPTSVVINPGRPNERTISDRVDDPGTLRAGDLVQTFVGGGGGIGLPEVRDPKRVADEVRDELLSIEDARAIYGVVVDATDAGAVAVDVARTAAARAGATTARSATNHPRHVSLG
jgi:N-methylhydantoinase B